jgi:hypothetical protein
MVYISNKEIASCQFGYEGMILPDNKKNSTTHVH